MAKRVTIADIAREAGVAKSTVSFVLNKKIGQVPISDATRNKVMKVVKAHNYQTNPIAKALVTKRTGHIGFILSDDMAGGFENMFFAACLSGAEEECRKNGYNLSISLYNLSCLESFIFPSSVNHRSIDGIVLAGYIADGVMKKFHEINMPCISIGDYTENAESLTVVGNNMISGTLNAINYAVECGHRKICLHYPTRRKDTEVAEKIKKHLKQIPTADKCNFHFCFTPDNFADYSAAKPLLEDYFSQQENNRSTVMIVNDQVAISLLKEIENHGLKCPKDISIISTSDTILCQMATPGITSVHYDLKQLGRSAVSLLLGNILEDKPLTVDSSIVLPHDRLAIRDSCRIL